MPEIAKDLQCFEDATRLIARGEALVAEQRRHLEQLREAGHPALQAELVLQRLKDALRTIRESESLIGRALLDIEVGRLRRLDTDSRVSPK